MYCHRIRNHVFYYVVGGIIVTLAFLGAGYQIPNIDLSLTELVVTSLLGI